MYSMPLKDVRKEHIKMAGSKAVTLAELLNAGFPVPPAFVLTSEAFIKFIQENGIVDKIGAARFQDNDIDSLRQKSVLLQEIILNSKMPEDIERVLKEEYEAISFGPESKGIGGAALDLIKAGRDNQPVAVRASLPVDDDSRTSFAGCMTAQLNVAGISRLAAGVKKCWASAFSMAAIFYRQRTGVEFAAPAVIVQNMVNSEKAGCMLTSMPFSGRPEVFIESSWGLGEAVTSGIVVPDSYQADRENGTISEKKAGRKRWIFSRDHLTGNTVKQGVLNERVSAYTLSDAEVKKLCELAMKVEEFFGRPQDIEWAAERGRLYVMQARPVTSVPVKEEHEGTALVAGLAASPGTAGGRPVVCANAEDLKNAGEGAIIAAWHFGMDTLPYLGISAAAVSEGGGLLSNPAKAARELKIPMITGAEGATSAMASWGNVRVDASAGAVYAAQDNTAVWETGDVIDGTAEAPEQQADVVGQEPQKMEPEVSDNWDAVSATNVIAEVAADEDFTGADGAIIRKAPDGFAEAAVSGPDEAVRMLADFIGRAASSPGSVWYMAGGRPEVLKCEIAAVRRLKEMGKENIGILLPSVSDACELKRVKSLADFPVKIGASIDTPAAVMEIEELCREGIAFAAINLSSISRLALGVDAGDSRVSPLSRPPRAAMRMAGDAISICRKYGVETAVCGMEPGPDTVRKFIELGVDFISARPAGIGEMRLLITKIEKKILLEKIRGTEPGKDVCSDSSHAPAV
jgi:pyruvate,water dikinase